MNKIIQCIVFLLNSTFLFGQSGHYIYEFLNLPNSARQAGHGAYMVPVRDADPGQFFINPAALSPRSDKAVSLDQGWLVSGILTSNLSYCQSIGGYNGFLGLSLVNYGDFERRDQYEQALGQFSAKDFALHLGASKQLYERMSIGADIKWISSNLAEFSSSALGIDVGAYYMVDSSNLAISLVFKHLGHSLSSYSPSSVGILPYNIQFGISKKLAHMPMRFGLVIHDLQRWDIRYYDPDLVANTDLFGNPVNNSGTGTVDNIFRHVAFTAEIFLTKSESFVLRMGYDHQRRKELSVTGLRGLEGFAFGGSIKLNRFRFQIGHTFFHQAGGLTQIGLSTNWGDFKPRKF